MKTPIVFNNFNIGGIADSEYHGIAHSLADMQCVDIHAKPGIAKVGRALQSAFSTDTLIVAIVPCSDGQIYFFGENGKIWMTNGQNFSLWKTLGKEVYDAKEFDGYVYFTTQTHIGRWQVGSDAIELQFGEFQNKDIYHPLHILNLVLYAGDGNLVAQVEDNIWTPDALDLPKGLKVKCLGSASTDLLIGTTVHSSVNTTQIFRWNTWSASWTIGDEIPEVGINAILAMDNAILVQAGNAGNIYAYNGQSLERHKRIPGNWEDGKAEVRLNATANMNGIPLFGLSAIQGEPTWCGVYSYGSYASNYPVVLNREMSTAGNTIGAIAYAGGEVYVSWKHGGTYGVDRLGNERAEKAVIITRVIDLTRESVKNGKVAVAWKSLPEGTDIRIYLSKNHGDWRMLDAVHDRNRHTTETRVNIDFGAFFQIKVEMLSSGTKTPEITHIFVTTT